MPEVKEEAPVTLHDFDAAIKRIERSVYRRATRKYFRVDADGTLTYRRPNPFKAPRE